MSLSAEQFRDHLVWTALKDLGPLIDQALAKEGLNTQSLEELSRLKAVLSFTGKRLAGADPYLFQSSQLDILTTALNTAATQVQHFIATDNVAHIAAANVEADKVLAAISQLNFQITTEDFVAAKEAAENYRLSFNKIFSDIKADASQIDTALESFRGQITALAEQVANEKQQLVAITNEYQSKFDTAQKVRLDEWQAKQKERQEDFDAIILKYTEGLKVQVDESTKFKDELKKIHTDYLDKMKLEFTDAASKILSGISERQREADILVGIIGDRGVTSGHQKAADEARTDALFWQKITVASMICLILLAVFIFLPQVTGTFSWESFAGRVFITLTVGVLAAYAGSQADKYQKIERYSRNLALELQAIGPFIAPLPQEKQDEFRVKIGERTFGQEAGNIHKHDDKSPTSVADVFAKSKDLSGFTTDLIKTTAEVIKNK
jgi:hypothetical protein